MAIGSYYSLDDVGAVVWDYIGKGLSRGQIVATIADQYDGEEADIERSLQNLFDQLLAEQLITPIETPPSDVPTLAMNGATDNTDKPQFIAPMLNKYTDMEDLLMLDPIHDVDDSGWPNTNPNNATNIE